MEMGVKDLIEVMRVEALSRLKEERKRRREFFRVRVLFPQTKNKNSEVSLFKKSRQIESK